MSAPMPLRADFAAVQVRWLGEKREGWGASAKTSGACGDARRGFARRRQRRSAGSGFRHCGTG